MQVELEYRKPSELTLVTAALLKAHPEWREKLERFHSISADSGVSEVFVEQVKATGFIHTPLFIEHIEDESLDLNLDVIVAGRKRFLTAKQLGYTEVPTLPYDMDESKSTAILEVTENLARRELSVKEKGEAYRKLFLQGMTQEQVAKLVGAKGARISQVLTVAEMPNVVHKAIDGGILSETAAYHLKSFGEKAPKASGRQKIYDEKVLAKAIEEMSEEARLVGGKGNGRIKTTQTAKNSAAKPADSFNKKNWEALYDKSDTPEDYKALIGFFIGKLSLKQAKEMADEHLDWLVRIEPTPKPRKIKEPKVSTKADKKGKKEEIREEDIAALFNE